MSKFADLLKSERKRAKMKLRETSEAINLSVSYISEMEQGTKAPPELGVVKKFQALFNTPDDLLVEAAEEERKQMPSNIISRIQQRPVLKELYFRAENMSDEQLQELLDKGFEKEE